jgi:hypothetical protein
VSSDGIKSDFRSNLNIFLAQKSKSDVKIDGVLEESEWNKDAALICDEVNSVYELAKWGWFGPEDKSASSIVKWDEEYL